MIEAILEVLNNATNATDKAKAKNPELVLLVLILGCIGIIITVILWKRSMNW